MSTVGVPDVSFTTLPEELFMLLIVSFIKPLSALFIGEISATIASASYTLVNKDYDTAILKVCDVTNFHACVIKSDNGITIPNLLTMMISSINK